MLVNTSVLPILLRFFVNLAIPPAVVLISSQFISSVYNVDLPTWSIVFAMLLSVPLTFAVRVQWTLFRHKRAAAAMGAVIPPSLQGKWPGNIDMLLRLLEQFDKGYPGELLKSVAPIQGNTVNFRMLWDNGIFTTEPENIKTILASDFNNYEKGAQFRTAMGSVLGVGVFNSDGDMWKFHRGMTRPFFSRDRIGHFELFDRHAEVALQKMKHRLRAGYPIDFQDLISRFTLDSATEFLFGHCVDSLSSSFPYPHDVIPPQDENVGSRTAEDFAKAFTDAQQVISVRSTIGWSWPLAEMFKDKTKNPMKVVDAYLGPILADAVTKARNQPVKKNEEIEDDETLLDHLVRYTSDPVVLHDETLNILIAGRDTTAGTLTFVIYFLAMHPEFIARLREEILTHVGPSRRPTYDDIRDMKFLRAVINETMRLYPAVPFNVRTSINATTWKNPDPNGKPFYIPERTMVPYSVFLMHRRTDLWGPDAEEFDPDRFLDDRLKKYLTPRPFIFLPFNAGPRICLGQQFAYNEMSFFLIRLLQNVDSIKLEPDAQPPKFRVPASWKQREGRESREQFNPKTHLTMYSAGGLWVKMNEAPTV